MSSEPPTRVDRGADRGTSAALTCLLILLAAYNLYAALYIAETYEVVPDGMTKTGYLASRQPEAWPVPESYEPVGVLVTSDEYDEVTRERRRFMDRINLIGISGILLYIGLRLTQPWYRQRLIQKFEKKGRLFR